MDAGPAVAHGALTGVRIENFRCIDSTQLDLAPRLNLLVGPNGSGKTSVLEAAYCLSRGHSFRSRDNAVLIRNGSTGFMVVGTVRGREREMTVGLEGTRGGTKARMGGENVRSLADLATTMAAQALHSESHQLVAGGPEERRRFLDWGAFHVEHGFVETWRRYRRALRQRNAALRAGGPVSAAGAWDEALVAAGERLDAMRQRYVARLRPAAADAVRALAGLELELRYRPGWRQEVSLGEALRDALTGDVEQGVTRVGPHRADLAVMAAGMPARHRVSRGQQKLIAAALVLAQSGTLREASETPLLLLLDDPAAELDRERLGLLLEAVVALGGQCLITALDAEPLAQSPIARTFHVEQGTVA